MLGGIVVSQWGTDAAFVIDSFTFLLSAIILIPLTIEQTVDENMKGPIFRTAIKTSKLGGIEYILIKNCLELCLPRHPESAGAGLAGVFLFLQAQIFQVMALRLDLVILLQRGIGTGIGPLIARSVFMIDLWPTWLGYWSSKEYSLFRWTND